MTNEIVIADPATATLPQIEHAMKADNRAYWRNPALQARAKELYQQEFPDPPEVAESQPSDAKRSDFDSPQGGWLRQLWADNGGEQRGQESYSKNIAAIIDALPRETYTELDSQVSSLSPTTRAAMAAEVSGTLPLESKPASPQHLQKFATTEHGAQLVAMWGRRAAERLGKLEARTNRVLAMLRDDPAARAEFEHFIEKISVDEFTAIADEMTR